MTASANAHPSAILRLPASVSSFSAREEKLTRSRESRRDAQKNLLHGGGS